MRPSSGYFPVFEPAICHYHLAVMVTHLWNAFLGYAWILRAVSIFSARDSLKGECPNPSAHDQTCFSRLVQKRIFVRSFVTPWALTKSVTTAFHCSEELCSPLYFLLRRFSNTLYSTSCDYTGWPRNNGTVEFSGLCSNQQLRIFSVLDRASFPYYNDTKIIKFG